MSILIPNKDHTDDLDVCLNSFFERADYQNYEFIIIENNSVLPETFAYYEKIEKEHDNVKVVYWEAGFNYSAINNFGFKFAKGDYIMPVSYTHLDVYKRQQHLVRANALCSIPHAI